MSCGIDEIPTTRDQPITKSGQPKPGVGTPGHFGQPDEEPPERDTQFEMGLVPSIFNSFGGAMFRAIALSWENPGFRQELVTEDYGLPKEESTAEPKGKLVTEDDTAGPPKEGFTAEPKGKDVGPYPKKGISKVIHDKASNALKKWLGYIYPFDVALVVKLDKNAKYVLKNGRYEWEKLNKTHLQLILPEEPKVPNMFPRALAAYNLDGPQFPFT